MADERRMREGCKKKKKKMREGTETTRMSERMIKCEKWNEEERDRDEKIWNKIRNLPHPMRSSSPH